MTKSTFFLTVLVFTVLGIYLFVSAPAPLPVYGKQEGERIPVETMFRVVAAENDVARTLYTKHIVGPGLKSGLKFSEDWQEHDVDAGPLPALFLRAASSSLERSPVPLGLFLGSDFPIAASNRLEGEQAKQFGIMRETHAAQFFYAADLQRHTAMFPDYAGVAPCVDCHNRHEQSPKRDWKLNELMGATTWTYPDDSISPKQFLEIISAVRNSFGDAYASYLEKAAAFSKPPPIGAQWPQEGYYLPDQKTFLAEFSRLASRHTLEGLLDKEES